MRSPRKVYAETIRNRGNDLGRFVDLTARVRVYRRNGRDDAHAAELLPFLYGGVWDTWALEYVSHSAVPYEFKIHPGQIRLLEAFDTPEIKRTLALGSQGGGKTEGVIVAAALLALWYPGRTGGIVAPTRARVKVVWRKFLKTIPPWWIREIRPGDQEIILVTGTLIQFFAAKRQGKQTGSPLAGNDWFWAVEDEQQDIDDESLTEVDARGRVNPLFQVFSSATNEPYGHFQRRVKEYQSNPSRRVVKFTGPDNAFVHPAHWENLKANWDPDAYRRKILCEELPIDGRVYPAFTMGENVKAAPVKPQVGSDPDITYRVTKAKYDGTGYQYVVGVDFGMRVTASVILKCYRPPSGAIWANDDRQWWVLDEVVTEHRTTDWHANELLHRFEQLGVGPESFLCFTGIDSNSTNPDRSDFVLFKRRNINIMRATYGKRLPVVHRYSMVNALLHSADGKRRLHVACDSSGRVKAKKCVDSLEGLRLNSSDHAETYGKGTKGGEDLTHYTDAIGYALFPFESFRGVAPATPPSSENDEYGNGTDRRRSK